MVGAASQRMNKACGNEAARNGAASPVQRRLEESRHAEPGNGIFDGNGLAVKDPASNREAQRCVAQMHPLHSSPPRAMRSHHGGGTLLTSANYQGPISWSIHQGARVVAQRLWTVTAVKRPTNSRASAPKPHLAPIKAGNSRFIPSDPGINQQEFSGPRADAVRLHLAGCRLYSEKAGASCRGGHMPSRLGWSLA